MKTIESYDQIPYESSPLTDTHPDYLAVIGRLFGLPAAPPERCRVLELGCAEGGNLTPLAWRYRDSAFLGVELSELQVAHGRRLIDTLGLTNIRLEHGNIMEVDAGWGEFDYILVHGVFSWVPRPVQDKILSICATNLAPAGIAYISYNTQPGWRLRGMLREMLLYHVRGVEGHRERITAAREMLAWLRTSAKHGDGAMARLVLGEVEHLATAADSYLYHEYLEETNEALLFSDFMQRATEHRLQYLAEAELHTMFPSTLDEATAATIEAIEDDTAREQYMDFARYRLFRKTLLCRADATLSRDIDLDALMALGCYGDLAPKARKVELNRARPQEYVSGAGESFTVVQPATKAALDILHRAYPDALSLAELEERALAALGSRAGGRADDHRAALREELFSLFAAQGVRFTAAPHQVFHAVTERPRAHQLARAQAALGIGCAATVRHLGLQLDGFAGFLLRGLDGSRTRDEWIAALLEEFRGGRLQLPGQTAGNVPSQAVVAANYDRLLLTFARGGLLEG